MNKAGRPIIFGAIFACICAGAGLLVVARGKEQACSDYTYKDAVRYVLSNLDGSGLELPRERAAAGSSGLTTCTAQAQTAFPGAPHVVNLCSKRTGEIVGHAEVFADCGLEWRPS